MNIHKEVTDIQQKWTAKLKRVDAEFFYNPGTIKDISIFCTQVGLKKRTFEDRIELELMLARYLQILMIMSSLSDDPRDILLTDKYIHVPYQCDDIIRRKNPYADAYNNFDRTFQIIKARYQLNEYCEQANFYNELLESNVPAGLKVMLDRVLCYYCTPLLGFNLVNGIKAQDFDYLKELQSLLKHIKNCYKNSKYVAAIEYLLISDFKYLRNKLKQIS